MLFFDKKFILSIFSICLLILNAAGEKQNEDLQDFIPFSLSDKPVPIVSVKSKQEFLKAETVKCNWKKVYPNANFVWQIGYLDNSASEYPRNISEMEGKNWDFDVDKDNWKKSFPGRILSKEARKFQRAQKISINFSIAQTGQYTLLSAFANAKCGWNNVKLSLDGKALSEYPIDGNNPGSSESAVSRYAETLELSKGKHILDIETISGSWVSIDSLALAKGKYRACFKAEEFKPEKWPPEKVEEWTDLVSQRPLNRSAAGEASVGGADVDLVIEKPTGAYLLEMIFSESFNKETNVAAKAGDRLFDIFVNGKKVFSDYDIFDRSKGSRLSIEKISVESIDGKITIGLNGTKTPARISAVKVYDKDGEKLLDEYEFISENPKIKIKNSTVFQEEYNAHFNSPYNLVANPGFEYSDEKAQVALWKTMGPGTAKQSDIKPFKGKYSLLLTGEKKSMLRSDLMSLISWDMPYSLSFQAKTDGKGRVRAKLLWYKNNVQYQDWQIKKFKFVKNRLQHEYAGASYGPWIELDDKWREIEFSTMPPRSVDLATFALEWECEKGNISVDDFFFDGKGARNIQLIASPLYETKGRKTAFVLTRTDCGGSGKFILRAADNSLVKAGELKNFGRCSWKLDDGTIVADSYWNRNIWGADFSDITASGRYNLEVVFSDGQMERTPVFEVRKGIFAELALHVMTKYFPVIRCGTEVPGWHPPCHMDDADILLPGGKRIHRNIRGGWHDAGDNNIFNFNVVNVCFAMSDFLRSTDTTDKKVLNELCWGLDYQVGNQDEKGAFLAAVKAYPNATPHGAVNMETDNNPDTPDNRVITPNLWVDPGMTAVAALLSAAEKLDTVDPAKAETYRKTADKAINHFAENGRLDNDTVAPFNLLVALRMQQSKFKFTYSLNPETELRKILRAMEDSSYLIRWPPEGRMDFPFVIALVDYIRSNPHKPEAEEAKKALKTFFDKMMIPICSGSPFEQIQEYRKDNRFMYGTYHGYDISYRYYAGYVLATGAEVLNDPELLRLAEAQVFWGIGLNHCGISSIGGIGWREQNAFNVSANSYKGHENGQYPGATHHCLLTGNGSYKPSSLKNPLIPPYIGMPFGFQTACILNDMPSFGLGAEQWISHAAPFIMACGQIEKTHAYFEKKLKK